MPGSLRACAVVFANELRRRALDRSAVLTAFVTPLLLAGILGFAFGGTRTPQVRIGLAGGAGANEQAIVTAGLHAAALPRWVHVVHVASAQRLHAEIADGTLQGGVVVPTTIALGPPATMTDLLTPAVVLGTGRRGEGFEVVSSPGSLLGTEVASTISSSIAARAYAGALTVAVSGTRAGSATAAAGTSPALAVAARTLGNSGRAALDYFSPSIAVVFLFMIAGLGTRSLLIERAEGTLVRLAAAPVRAGSVVAGKLLAIFATALASILVMWGATTVLFRADWGAPGGVLLMCVGAALAMSSISVALTSLARDQDRAFGIAMTVGMVFAFLGGNFVPPGALPTFFADLSLGTPNGWTLVGFGRLAIQHRPASAAFGPFLVLLAIAAVFGAFAASRVKTMVEL